MKEEDGTAAEEWHEGDGEIQSVVAEMLRQGTAVREEPGKHFIKESIVLRGGQAPPTKLPDPAAAGPAGRTTLRFAKGVGILVHAGGDEPDVLECVDLEECVDRDGKNKTPRPERVLLIGQPNASDDGVWVVKGPRRPEGRRARVRKDPRRSR
jgi:hypothetical protein